jgi:hypothetical protein
MSHTEAGPGQRPKEPVVERSDALEAELAERLARLAGSVPAIDARLAAIEREWDIEQVLEASTVLASAIGTGVALARRRRLLSLNLPANVALFLLQHAVPEARPPRSLLRRLGFRTRAEIERERAALLALRGPDAGPLPAGSPRSGLFGAVAGIGRRAAMLRRSPKATPPPPRLPKP